MKEYKLKSGNILRVIQDPNPESPDIWGNEDMFLVYDHRQFTVKREGFEPKNIFNALSLEYPKEPVSDDYKTEEEYIDARDEYHADMDDVNSIKAQFLDYYIFPVDAYIHSGVHLSLADTKNYPDRRWDVSTTGYVLVKKDQILPEYDMGVVETALHYRAKEMAESLIETWNQYLSGDVYGFKVLKSRNVKKELVYNMEQSFLKEGFEIPLDVIENSLDTNIIKELQSYVEYEEIDSCCGFYGDDPKTNGMIEHINDEIIEE